MHMYANVASIIPRYFADGYLHFSVKFVPLYYDWGRRKYHHVVCFPATLLPRGNSTIKRENGCAQTHFGKTAICFHSHNDVP